MPYAEMNQVKLKWTINLSFVTDVYLWTKEHNDLMFFYLG